ncbi:MAG: sulfite exporter TauE/SafE family protein [Pseudomonadota bacterium]
MQSFSSFFEPLGQFELSVILGAAAVVALGSFVKGAIGFALPTIAFAFITMFLTPQETIGLMILPLLLSNWWQMMRQGMGAAWHSLRSFWRLNLVLFGLIGFVAQAVPHIAPERLVLVLGLVVSLTAALQLAGWRPAIPAGGALRRRGEIATGGLAGVIGGLTGVWGPPVMFFLIALGISKTEQIRVQGVCFFLGSVVLVGAHLTSGVINAATLPFSVAMVPAMALGMLLGLKAQDRLDQERFRRITLLVLCLAGLNLLRQGLGG